MNNENKNQKSNSEYPNQSAIVSKYYIGNLIDDKGPQRNALRRRGISDIIAVLLLLGITVAGAVLVSTFFSDTKVLQFNSSNSGTQNAALKITGYDTRDGLNLSEIGTIDNKLDSPTPILCTMSCNVTPNALPSASGTDFIVLNLENEGITKVTLQAIEINGVEHTWASPGGTDLMQPNTFPLAGKFSIIPTTNGVSIMQRTTNEIDRNDEVRVVVKLSETIDPDIGLSDSVRIKLLTNLIDSSDELITSGSVR
jgi:flagellin-like protein